jgi:TolB-like protein/DNA-binding winged helix-turn-helix (wHTH) protein
MIYIFGDCALDTCLYSVQRGGKTIRLRPKAFHLCIYLLQNRERVVSAKELCAQVWSGQFISPRTLEGVIRAVRQALGDSGQVQGIIQTVYGYGYRFVAAVEESPSEVPKRGVWAGAEMPIAEGGLALKQTVDTDRGPPMSRMVQALALVILSCLVGWGRWQGMAVGDMPDKSSIAVLPFISLSAGEDYDHVADGMTAELIAELSEIPGLTVIPRALVMQYEGSRQGVATIGRELQVGMILEGSVRSVGNKLRINAQLIDVVSEGYVWARKYDRELTEVWDLESDIATQVAQQVKLHLAVRREQ